jgi:hypothetical protein
MPHEVVPEPADAGVVAPGQGGGVDGRGRGQRAPVGVTAGANCVPVLTVTVWPASTRPPAMGSAGLRWPAAGVAANRKEAMPRGSAPARGRTSVPGTEIQRTDRIGSTRRAPARVTAAVSP